MGFGVGHLLKGVVPLSVYLCCIIALCAALSGRAQWTFLFVVILIPLRNVLDHVRQFPLGAQIITILMAAMILGWIFSGASKNKAFEKAPLNVPAILLIIYTTISLYVGNFYMHGGIEFYPGDSRFKDWKNFCLLPVLFWLTLNFIRDRKWVERVFWVICFTMLFMDYYTVKQESWYSSLIARDKISSTFQFLGVNEVAAFYNEYTIILMSIYFFMKDRRKKQFLLFLILLNIYCVIFTYSRGAYLGIAFGMLVLFTFKNRKFLVPLLLVVVFWQHILPEKSIERIKSTTNSEGQLDDSSEFRVLIWKRSLEMFSNSPLVGIGYGVFRTLGLILGDTHNIYVKILVEEGTLGMIAFLIVIFAFIRTGFILYQKGEDDFSKGLGLGLLACMATLLVNNIFGDRWSYFELSAYLWVFAGLASRLIILNQERQPVSLEEKKAKTAAVTPQKPKKKLRYYDL